MLTTNTALILAAGNGSRLAQVSGGKPKPLVELNGRPLLEHVLLGVRQAGIRRCVVVVGYRAHLIRWWLGRHPFRGLHIEVVENPEYGKPNGVSVLRAEPFIKDPFLLLMADHVFEPETAANLLRESIEPDEVILAVDRKLHGIFDLNDATKVACRNAQILDIGKDLNFYDAIDTGMFLCNPILFSWLTIAMKAGRCSLSSGMRLMALHRNLRAFDIGNAVWQDVDTPEALAHAETIFGEQRSPALMLEDVAIV